MEDDHEFRLAKVHANKYFPTRLPIAEALWKALQLGSLDKHAKKERNCKGNNGKCQIYLSEIKPYEGRKLLIQYEPQQENKRTRRVWKPGARLRGRLQLAPLVEDSARTCGVTVVPSTSKELVEPKRVEMVAALRVLILCKSA